MYFLTLLLAVVCNQSFANMVPIIKNYNNYILLQEKMNNTELVNSMLMDQR